MMKKKLTFNQLIEKNKEEILKNRAVIEKIERELDEKKLDSTKKK